MVQKGRELAAPSDVRAQMESASFKEQLALAIPNQLKPERMVRLALTLLKKNDTLAKCTPLSIMACVVDAAQIGLELENVQGHAYIVPFQGTATLIVGYRGFMHLIYQTGIVSEISSEIVRKGDEFSFRLGTQRQLMHVPKPVPEKDSEKNWLGAYAVAEFLTGRTAFQYLEAVEIMQARSRSASYRAHLKFNKDTPWIGDDAVEMWKKTAVRRLAKKMPTSTTDKRGDLLRAVMLDEYGERRGLLIPTLGGHEVNPHPPEDTSAVDPAQSTDDLISEEHVDERGQNADAAVAEAKKKSTKGKKVDLNTGAQGGVPKANKGPIDVKAESAKTGPAAAAAQPAPKPKSDPPITAKEASNIYNVGVQNGWKVDEIKAFINKTYSCQVQQLPTSKLSEVMDKMTSGA